jgi:aldehyde dehydrogenase (NAD+)
MTKLDLLPKGGMLIGDQWVDQSSGGTFDHVNAATGRVQKTIAVAADKEIDAAVEAARTALPGWRALPPNERRDLLFRLGTLIKENATELATLNTLENSVPSAFATFLSGFHTPENFFYYGGWAEKIEGSVIPVYPERALDYTLLEPYGVVAVLVPWNGPLGSIGMKAAPALAAGNTIVIKPPDIAPFTALRFGELCLEAGIPPGVVNVVPGGGQAGAALVKHPGVDKITFTGGPETARAVLAGAAENLTPVVLELGGKSANILFEDANLDVAVPSAVMHGVAALSGQGCLLPTRLLVHQSIYSDVVKTVGELTENLAVGDPFAPETVMGPVVSSGHCERIMGIIERAKQSQAGQLLTGGERLGGPLADGFFIAPTVFTDVDPTSELAQQEVFGPVLSVFPFGTEEEAIALANSTRYGLAGYLWTNDVQRAHRVGAQLEAGSIGLNSIPMAPVNAPFGGYKTSGYGREGGRAGLDEFLRIKNVHLPLT